jgi:hypothetical protein
MEFSVMSQTVIAAIPAKFLEMAKTIALVLRYNPKSIQSFVTDVYMPSEGESPEAARDAQSAMLMAMFLEGSSENMSAMLTCAITSKHCTFADVMDFVCGDDQEGERLFPKLFGPARIERMIIVMSRGE